jgi:hypothetical protein
MERETGRKKKRNRKRERERKKRGRKSKAIMSWTDNSELPDTVQ